MADDMYDQELALDGESGTVIAGAVAQIYAIEDEGFTTPLEIVDPSGVPLTSLVSSAKGMYPAFRVVSGEQRVWAVAGDLVTPLTSSEGRRGLPGPAGPPGDGVDTSASAPGQVLMSTGPGAPPVWSAPPTSAGITGAPSAWPSVFPAESHTHASGQITDASTIGRQVLSAVDAQAARSAIGAGTGNGTSNLALGTSATTAAAGNHSHGASTLPFTPTGSITATDVQGAIVQAAASGGGTAVQDTLTVMYASGAYPTQAASAPAGVKVRHFYGPVQYMGPTWAGVLDLYTYAELT